MRELKRSIAKARMREAGIPKLFHKSEGGEKSKKQSPFSKHWRKYIKVKPKAKPSPSFGLSKKRHQYWEGQKARRGA